MKTSKCSVDVGKYTVCIDDTLLDGYVISPKKEKTKLRSVMDEEVEKLKRMF